MICKKTGCTQSACAKKLCKRHYDQQYYATRKQPHGFCIASACQKPAHSRGYCAMHYHRMRRAGEPGFTRRIERYAPDATCKQSDCIERPTAGGFCKRHYQAAKHGHYQRLSRYGLTESAYRQLLLKQGSTCAICEKPPQAGKSLVVDHDHKTGKIRGLLHSGCNRGIGLLHDDFRIALRAARYLRDAIK
jgi:hypothetical protein